MNITEAKDNIKKMLGKKVKAKVYMGRNKYESYEGIINEIYPSLFTIKVGKNIKSYSYADLLIRNIIIQIK